VLIRYSDWMYGVACRLNDVTSYSCEGGLGVVLRDVSALACCYDRCISILAKIGEVGLND
jgi:hypothetical protein